jgi:hypothetical protein
MYSWRFNASYILGAAFALKPGAISSPGNKFFRLFSLAKVRRGRRMNNMSGIKILLIFTLNPYLAVSYQPSAFGKIYRKSGLSVFFRSGLRSFLAAS